MECGGTTPLSPGATRRAGKSGDVSPHSKVFDTTDFGYTKVCVERPLRLRYDLTPEQRKALRLDATVLKLKDDRGDQLAAALDTLAKQAPWKDDAKFCAALAKALTWSIPGGLKKTYRSLLAVRDETAVIVKDDDGHPVPDSELRDFENVPLKEDIDAYFAREVLPHVPDLPAPRPSPGEFCIYVLKCADGSFYIGQTDHFPRRLKQHENGEVSWTGPRLPVEPIHWEVFATREEAVKREDNLKTGFGRKWLKREYEAGRLAGAARQAGAWMDRSKDKVGYEISFTKYFYEYTPLRSTADIAAELLKLDEETENLLREVVKA
jgi:predicted GIY-YIG superfamily endonuclease